MASTNGAMVMCDHQWHGGMTFVFGAMSFTAEPYCIKCGLNREVKLLDLVVPNLVADEPTIVEQHIKAYNEWAGHLKLAGYKVIRVGADSCYLVDSTKPSR